MRHPRHLMWKTFVRQYYRQNVGFFFFFFIIFFGIVGPSQQLAYHYALIRGILDAPSLLALVLFLWLLYSAKCSRWILGLLHSADHTFLHILPLLGRTKTFRLLLMIQAALYLPIILYATAILIIAFSCSSRAPAIILVAFISAICLGSSALYQYALFHPGDLTRLTFMIRPADRRPVRKKYTPYWSFLLRGFLTEHTALLTGIKIFACGILYLLLSMQTQNDYDIRMPFLFFSMALFGHGALIYQLRKMEDQQLFFYRSLPVSMINRMTQYAVLYLLVLLPEMITLGWLTPDHIRVRDAAGFVFAGYSTLLLLNGCLFIAALERSELLKLTGILFGILYFGVLADHLFFISGLFLVAAGCLFFRGYAQREE
jgi:hypothetical protein